MVYSEYCRDKLSQSKIQGQFKPFIDKNLQLQLPEWDSSPLPSDSCNPIYSHFIGYRPSTSYLSLPINEAELHQAIAEADGSYDAWEKMKKRLYQEMIRFSP